LSKMDLLLFYKGLLPKDIGYKAEEICEPSQGLYSIAAMSIQHGFETKIINTSYYSEKKEDEILDQIEIPKLLIGLSQSTLNRHACYYLVNKIKKKFPYIPIVLGGVHATIFFKEILEKHNEIDYIILGEGEYTIIKLLQALKLNQNIKNISGIAYRYRGKICSNNLSDGDYDFNSIPSPLQFFPTNYIQTTRGCPYNCNYCSTNVITNNNLRIKDIKKVINEVHLAVFNHSISHIAISDDLFVYNKNNLRYFSDEIKQNKIPVTFDCNLRVNLIEEKIIQQLAAAGCTRVLFGIESASERIRKLYNKKISDAQIRSAVRLCKKYGIKVGLSFILSGWYDNEDTLKSSFLLCKKLKPYDVLAHALYLYPGSTFYTEAVARGELDSNVWEEDSEPLTPRAYAGYPKSYLTALDYSRRLNEFHSKNKSNFDFTTKELEAIWMNYNYPVTGLKLIAQYYNKEYYKESERLIDLLIKNGYNYLSLHSYKALITMQYGNSLKALKNLENKKDDYPKSSFLYFTLAEIAEQSKQFEKSLEYNQIAYQYDTNQQKHLLKSAFLYEKMENYKKAFDCFSELNEDWVFFSTNISNFIKIKLTQLGSKLK
jgi:anaerobic magnesium-protoporphyrin IX monomethyl ester cyclase